MEQIQICKSMSVGLLKCLMFIPELSILKPCQYNSLLIHIISNHQDLSYGRRFQNKNRLCVQEILIFVKSPSRLGVSLPAASQPPCALSDKGCLMPQTPHGVLQVVCTEYYTSKYYISERCSMHGQMTAKFIINNDPGFIFLYFPECDVNIIKLVGPFPG